MNHLLVLLSICLKLFILLVIFISAYIPFIIEMTIVESLIFAPVFYLCIAATAIYIDQRLTFWHQQLAKQQKMKSKVCKFRFCPMHSAY